MHASHSLELATGYLSEKYANEYANMSTLYFDSFKRKSRVVTFLQLYIDLSVLINHFVLEVPSSTSAKLSDYRVTITEHINIEVDVGAGLV